MTRAFVFKIRANLEWRTRNGRKRTHEHAERDLAVPRDRDTRDARALVTQS